MTRLLSSTRALMQDRKGVTALEYGLIAAFITVGIVTLLPGIGTKLKAAFQTISTTLGA